MGFKREIMELIPWLVAVYAVICVAAYFGNRLYMYFPDPTRVAPADAGLDGVEYYLLDRFRLDIELSETRQGTARDVVRLEKINLAGGERWVWQELEQARLDLGHRKGQRYEQSPFPHEV
jgi:hypothetical protein